MIIMMMVPFVVKSVIYLSCIGFDAISVSILNLHIGFKMIVFRIVLSNSGNALVFFWAAVSLSRCCWWKISSHCYIFQHVFITTFQLPRSTEGKFINLTFFLDFLISKAYLAVTAGLLAAATAVFSPLMSCVVYFADIVPWFPKLSFVKVTDPQSEFCSAKGVLP